MKFNPHSLRGNASTELRPYYPFGMPFVQWSANTFDQGFAQTLDQRLCKCLLSPLSTIYNHSTIKINQ